MNVATDSLGQMAETNFYYPYGEDWIKTGYADIHYKFTDQEKDSETGVYYYKARYYDPVLGRFTSPDPLLQAAFDPSTFSRLAAYKYSANLPPINSLALRTSHLLNNGGAIASNMLQQIGSNPYMYVKNNPTNLNDPTGLITNDDIFLNTAFDAGWSHQEPPNPEVVSAFYSDIGEVATVYIVVTSAPMAVAGAAEAAAAAPYLYSSATFAYNSLTLDASVFLSATSTGFFFLNNGYDILTGPIDGLPPEGWGYASYGLSYVRDYMSTVIADLPNDMSSQMDNMIDNAFTYTPIPIVNYGGQNSDGSDGGGEDG